MGRLWLVITSMTISFMLTISITIESLYDYCQCQIKEPAQPQTTIHRNQVDTRPQCLTWYVVHEGQNQWQIAEEFSNGLDNTQWIKSMRYMSHKAPDDESVRTNESVCVDWEKIKIQTRSRNN